MAGNWDTSVSLRAHDEGRWQRSSNGAVSLPAVTAPTGSAPPGRLIRLVVIGISLILPGIAHIRLGAVVTGAAFLLLTALLSAVQFGVPFIDPTPDGALFSGAAFALGWLVSVAAARSAARLIGR